MLDSAKRAYVVRPGEGSPVKLRTALVWVKASSATTDGVLTCVETRDPPGFLAPRHVHHTSSEGFYVLEGSYLFGLSDEKVQCDAGSFIFIPRGVAHGYTAGDAAGRLLILYSPPGIDEMWQEMELASAERPLTDHERDAIGRKYDVEWR